MKEEKPHIIGKTAGCDSLFAMHPLFEKAFGFLKRQDIASLPEGRYEIVDGKCWASVQKAHLAPPEERKLEFHRRFIDIQAPLSGPEAIGLAVADPSALALPFDSGKDCVLYDGAFEISVLQPGDFAVFLPPLGAHAPCIRAPGGPESIRKVVIKVAAE